MAKEVEIKPTPIQRNTLDVAIELTQLFYKNRNPNNLEELRETYLKLYAATEIIHNTSRKNLKPYLPDELQEIVQEMYKNR